MENERAQQNRERRWPIIFINGITRENCKLRQVYHGMAETKAPPRQDVNTEQTEPKDATPRSTFVPRKWRQKAACYRYRRKADPGSRKIQHLACQDTHTYLIDGAGEDEVLLVLHRIVDEALEKVAQGALAPFPGLDGGAQHHGRGGLTVRQLERVDHHRQRGGFAGCARTSHGHERADVKGEGVGFLRKFRPFASLCIAFSTSCRWQVKR